MERAILDRHGIASELVLLYQSTDPGRAGYQLDYDCALELMSAGQSEWLMTALKTTNPSGHQWIKQDSHLAR